MTDQETQPEEEQVPEARHAKLAYVSFMERDEMANIPFTPWDELTEERRQDWNRVAYYIESVVRSNCRAEFEARICKLFLSED